MKKRLICYNNNEINNLVSYGENYYVLKDRIIINGKSYNYPANVPLNKLTDAFNVFSNCSKSKIDEKSIISTNTFLYIVAHEADYDRPIDCIDVETPIFITNKFCFSDIIDRCKFTKSGNNIIVTKSDLTLNMYYKFMKDYEYTNVYNYCNDLDEINDNYHNDKVVAVMKFDSNAVTEHINDIIKLLYFMK